MGSDTLESLRPAAHYDSFLLRTWRPASGGQWRWMIENVMTGERYTFTDLPELVLFLRNEAHGRQRPGHRRPPRQRAAAIDRPDSAKE